MLIVTSEELAAGLLARLQQIVGHAVEIEQVDFVECEDAVHVMAYCYGVGEDFAPLCFIRPPFFEPSEVETLMMSGGVAPAVVH